MKRYIILLFSVFVLSGIISQNTFAAELDKNEQYILETITNENFPGKIEQRYVNQFRNYFYQEGVSVKKSDSEDFIRYYIIAVQKKQALDKDNNSINNGYQYVNYMQRALNKIGLYFEYDSKVNGFYGVDQEGTIVIDLQDIIKHTDEIEEDITIPALPGEEMNIKIPEKKDNTEQTIWSTLIVVLFILFGFLIRILNTEKVKKKLSQYNSKDKTVTKLLIKLLDKKKIYIIFKYIYVPVAMSIIVLTLGGFYINAINIKEQIRDNLSNGCLINELDKGVRKNASEDAFEKTVKAKDVVWPKYGIQYAQIRNKKRNIDAPLYWGDRGSILTKGAGSYCGASIPGNGGQILIGAHDTTFFEGLKDVEEGDEFIVKTTYGTYDYKVTKIKIYDEKDFDKAYDLNSKKEEMILYTCYPFGEFNGDKNQRMFVYFDRVKGPDIIF